MKDKLLTIAIPTYNRAPMLMRALRSISSQYDDRIEVIVSDNASSDNTEQIINEIQKEMPIYYVKNYENIGADANFLQCYNLAKGAFVLLLGDDDLIIEDRLKTILEFLNDNMSADLVFINHIFFSGNYHGKDDYFRLWSDDLTNKMYVSKKDFLQYGTHRLTFMSCLILSNKAFKKVENPERFVGTYFMHTCVSFMATKNPKAILGVIGIPCIANDVEDERNIESSILKNNYKIFGKGMEYTLCTIGSECGYDHRILTSIWTDFVGDWFGFIVRLKSEYGDYMKQQFFEYGYPVIKKYPALYFKTMIAVIMPRFLARFLWHVIRPLKHKMTSKIKQLSGGA